MPDFVESELERPVKLGILEEVSQPLRVVNPLTAVYSNKMRLVLDCRLVNPLPREMESQARKSGRKQADVDTRNVCCG